jgi:hypothetical protein
MHLRFLRLALLALLFGPALAHDRHGNAAMHQDVEVQAGKDNVELTFRIETNDEARMVEAIAIDADGDGKLSPAEQSRYFAQLDARLREGLQVVYNEQVVPLQPSAEVTLSPPSRKEFRFRGDVPAGIRFPANVQVYNDNFLDWPGKNEVLCGGSERFRLAVVLRMAGSSPEVALGVLQEDPPHPADTVNTFVGDVDWKQWSWAQRLLSRLYVAVIATLLGVSACVIVLAGRRSISARVVAAVLAAASLVGMGLAVVARNPHHTDSQGWVHEFRVYHRVLSRAIGEYHARADSNSLGSLTIPSSLARFTAATRVMDASNESVGAFELRRVKPIATTILDEPRYPLYSKLRIRHTWRAIGLIRHHGHPHERTREFSCDYTLRATERGLVLLDCSDWHQLPDEPIDE